MATQKEIWEQWTPPETLVECINLLFEILDTVEESDEGRRFKPTYITSCRVWDTHRLGKILPKLKELCLIDEKHLPINTRHLPHADEAKTVVRYPARKYPL